MKVVCVCGGHSLVVFRYVAQLTLGALTIMRLQKPFGWIQGCGEHTLQLRLETADRSRVQCLHKRVVENASDVRKYLPDDSGVHLAAADHVASRIGRRIVTKGWYAAKYFGAKKKTSSCVFERHAPPFFWCLEP